MLTFILVLLLIYLLFRYFMPYLLPRILMFWVKQHQHVNQARQQKSQKPEGTIDIKYQPPKARYEKSTPSEGDYIDFEEIKN